MSPDDYRAALDRLDLSHVRAAELLGVNERTSRRWVSGMQEVPRAVVVALRLMLKHGENPSAWMP